MKIIGRSRTPIGIDIGSRSIKAVQLQPPGPGLANHQIVAISVLPRPETGRQIDREEITKLKQMLKRQGFWGNDVVLAPPEDKLLRGIFEVPRKVSGPALAQIARMELSRTHGVVPDSFEMVCWEPAVSDQSKSTVQAIVLGCPHDVANALLDVFEQSGFSVRALDASSAAAARACACLTVRPPAITCILDLGWCSTKVLFACGQTVIYERRLDETYMAKLVSKLTEKSGITEESACQVAAAVGLAAGNEPNVSDEPQPVGVAAIRKILSSHFDVLLEEIKAPFAYANRQYPNEGIKRLLLIGGGAAISGLPQYLQQALCVEVTPAAPCDLLACSDHIRTKAANPAATVALGLAKFAARLNPSELIEAGSPRSGV